MGLALSNPGGMHGSAAVAFDSDENAGLAAKHTPKISADQTKNRIRILYGLCGVD